MTTLNKTSQHFIYLIITLITGFFCVSLAQAQAVYKVGTAGTPSCTHNDLSQALSDASVNGTTTIQIAANYLTPYSVVIANRDVVLRGGNDGCSGTRANANDRSTIEPLATGSAMLIVNSNAVTPQKVTLENINITGGHSNADGGGLKVVGDPNVVTVNLNNSVINGNSSGARGGGVFIKGSGVTLKINDSKITQNQSLDGGGLGCVDGTVQFNSGEISENIVENFDDDVFIFGGGISLRGCVLTTQIGGGPRYISRNIAAQNHLWDETASGAGMYITDSIVRMGTSDYITVIDNNENNFIGYDRLVSNTDGSGSKGGGIYISNADSIVALTNVQLVDNRANLGAGIFLSSGDLTVSSNHNCATSAEFPFCASFTGNKSLGYGIDDCNINHGQHNIYSGQGGGIYQRTGNLVVDGVAFIRNVADKAEDLFLCRDSLERWPHGSALFLKSTALVTNSIFAFNGSDQSFDVIRVHDDGDLDLNHSTFYGTKESDYLNGGFEITIGGQGPKLSVFNTIFNGAGDDVEVYLPAGAYNETGEFDCVLADDDGNIHEWATTVGRVTQASQSFVDPSGLDFHLTDSGNTGAIDFCTPELEIVSTNRDFDGEWRPDDHPGITNGGTIDLGAYEFHTGNHQPIVDLVTNFDITPNPVPQGNELAFTVTLENHGVHNIYNAAVKIELDARGVENVPPLAFDFFWSCNQSSTANSIIIDCNYSYPISPSNPSTPLTLTGTASGVVGGRYINAATASTTTAETNPNNNKGFKHFDVTDRLVTEDLIFKSSFD